MWKVPEMENHLWPRKLKGKCLTTDLPKIRRPSSSRTATPTWQDVLSFAITWTPRPTATQRGGTRAGGGLSCELLTLAGHSRDAGAATAMLTASRAQAVRWPLPCLQHSSPCSHPCFTPSFLPSPFPSQLQKAHMLWDSFTDPASCIWARRNMLITIWNQMPTNEECGTLTSAPKYYILYYILYKPLFSLFRH